MADEKDKGGNGGAAGFWGGVGLYLLLGLAWHQNGFPGGGLTASSTSRSPFVRSTTYDRPAAVYPALSADDARASSPSSAARASIRLSRGTASGAIRPGLEYIILSAPRSNPAPVNISGWTLANGRDQQYKIKNNKLVAGQVSRAVIPQGAVIFNPDNHHALGPILLNPGERAYVVTGAGPNRNPYPIKVSFKTNKCFGYVESANDYSFSPRIGTFSCPRPEDELADIGLAKECESAINRLSRCEVPEIERRREVGTTLNDRPIDVPRLCLETIAERLNYPACVTEHRSDEDFLGDEWYVFLNQRYELWDDRDETISLYDNFNQLVAQVSY